MVFLLDLTSPKHRIYQNKGGTTCFSSLHCRFESDDLLSAELAELISIFKKAVDIPTDDGTSSCIGNL